MVAAFAGAGAAAAACPRTAGGQRPTAPKVVLVGVAVHERLVGREQQLGRVLGAPQQAIPHQRAHHLDHHAGTLVSGA